VIYWSNYSAFSLRTAVNQKRYIHHSFTLLVSPRARAEKYKNRVPDLPVLYTWTRPLPCICFILFPPSVTSDNLTSSIWCCSGRNYFPAIQSWARSTSLQWKERAKHNAVKASRWYKRRQWQWAPQRIEEPRGWRNRRLKMWWSCAMLLSSYLLPRVYQDESTDVPLHPEYPTRLFPMPPNPIHSCSCI